MKVKLKVWRQKNGQSAGKFETYELDGVVPEMSFLEMMDFLNEKLLSQGIQPVEFDSDCREGICGSCSCMINGQAHGPLQGVATCQLYMRKFKDGEEIVVEPWRAKAFPVVKDLVVDRGAFDRIISAGGYVSVNTAKHADGNAILVPKHLQEKAFEAANCIGCGACVAACPNASASLFTAAKISHLALLPQGHPERSRRVQRMVERMDQEGFGNCTNIGECRAACPKEISIDNIAKMKREYLRSLTELDAVEIKDSGMA